MPPLLHQLAAIVLAPAYGFDHSEGMLLAAALTCSGGCMISLGHSRCPAISTIEFRLRCLNHMHSAVSAGQYVDCRPVLSTA